MEIRQELRRIPSRPIVFLTAALAAMALAVTGWYVVTSQPSSHPGTVVSSGFPGPDATELNQQIKESHLKNPEQTHGH